MDVLKKGKKIKNFRQEVSKCGNHLIANILTEIAKSHTGLRHPTGGGSPDCAHRPHAPPPTDPIFSYIRKWVCAVWSGVGSGSE